MTSHLRAPRDGYLRITAFDTSQQREWLPATADRALVFIDTDGEDLSAGRVVDVLKRHSHRLVNTKYLLIRWPIITSVPTDHPEITATVNAWLKTLTERIDALNLFRAAIGIVTFGIGHEPTVRWSAEPPALHVERDETVLQRALVAELQAMLEWGHAVWRPSSYHYQLPSGDHAGVFVRVSDAFRTPRDVRVVSSWIASRLRDGMAIVADSATLVPLMTDLRALVAERRWQLGGVEMLDDYPRTRFDMMRAMRPLAAARVGLLGLLSVSASGNYKNLMSEILSSTSRVDDNWSMIILVQKGGSAADHDYIATPTGVGEQRVSTWLEVTDQGLNPLDAATCEICRRNEHAQVVRIDPRTFEALALPGFNLVTPNVAAARQSVGLWDCCDDAKAIGVEVQPASASKAARPQGLMGVRVHLDKLLSTPTSLMLTQEIASRIEDIRREHRRDIDERRRADPEGPLPPGADRDALTYNDYDAVVVTEHDAALQGFAELYAAVRQQIQVPVARYTPISDTGALPPEAQDWSKVLIFSVGAVTGWHLRQLHLRLEDSWQGRRNEVSALVMHARPATHREWETLGRSFRDQLDAIWLTYLPWRSPIAEEALHLTQVAPLGELSEHAQAFLAEREAYCTPRSEDFTWDERVTAHYDDPAAPDPYSVLWGASDARGGATKVRTQSNFGYEVDALTAYVAIGAAMQAQRQKADQEDPRWRVFEFPAITRSYYDAILLAAMLRWCEPQEAWWGDSSRQAQNAMSELIARTRDEGDRKVLYPELLLAASQGKIPHAAVGVLIDQIEPIVKRWPPEHQAPVELGIALWRGASISSPTPAPPAPSATTASAAS